MKQGRQEGIVSLLSFPFEEGRKNVERHLDKARKIETLSSKGKKDPDGFGAVGRGRAEWGREGKKDLAVISSAGSFVRLSIRPEAAARTGGREAFEGSYRGRTRRPKGRQKLSLSVGRSRMIDHVLFVSAAGWVGWKNENSPVKIVFELDSVRRFHYVSVTWYARKDFGIQVRN